MLTISYGSYFIFVFSEMSCESFYLGKKTTSALFVNLGFQRKLAKFAISTWGKDVLNFYTIVILLPCFCSCLWTVLCAEILYLCTHAEG